MVHLRGKVTDANGKPVNANVTVTDLGTDQIVQTGHTDNGNYDFEVKSPGKYSVTADADGYLFGSAYFEVDDQGRILKGKHDITLSPATGRTRLLVFFDFDKADLQPESYPELSRAMSLMKANPSMQVEIAGYTDSKGSDDYNIDLSQRRANAVKDYLIKHGIEKRRVTARGYGKADPIASNDTEDGRAENRRVEFVVVKR
jgi:outer membrane protein OmpA-like peptidoglycan-associated protein